MTRGWTRAVEGKEPGCGSGCGDRPGNESTSEGQLGQGRGVLSAKAAAVSRNQQAGTAISPYAAGLCSYCWWDNKRGARGMVLAVGGCHFADLELGGEILFVVLSVPL